MDKLEQYLSQVCRGLGGPRRLREHLRQELREHLQDAAARHRAAGLADEAALAQALEDFGQPEEVRSELEGAHGQRIMAVLIDKALEWKEMTMKAKWFWTSWAYLALVVVIVLEVLFITFNVMLIVPRFHKLVRDGVIDPSLMVEQGVGWIPGFLDGLARLGGDYAPWLLLAAALAVAVFEWRVRNENKPFIRLSALGTAAVGLLVTLVLMSAALVISFTLAVPAVGRLVRPYALQQTASIDTSLIAIEQALAKKDWEAMPKAAERASLAVGNLSKHAVVPALAIPKERGTIAEENRLIENLRTRLQTVGEEIDEARQAISARDAGRLQAALRKLGKSYEPVREAAKRVETH